MAMVQRPTDVTPGAPAGDARAAVVTGLSLRAAERAIETQIETQAHLMSDEAKAFMAIGESFAKHETVKHSSREYVRDTVHVNSVEGFNSRVRQTIAGVFHHIAPNMPTCISMKSASAGLSASCLEAPFGKLGTAGKSSAHLKDIHYVA
jgi:ISXO2-like transposase domain